MAKKVMAFMIAALCMLGLLPSCNGNGEDTTAATTAPADTTVPAPIIENIKNGSLDTNQFYKNPLTDNAADPMIVEHNGVYYMYSTGGKEIYVKTSKNLVSWSKQSAPIFKASSTAWATGSLWAPEVHKYNGKFYLFYCAKNKSGIFNIDVAVSDTPNGNFIPISSAPLLNTTYHVIDANFFCDGDGRTYLYYSKSHSTNKVNGKNTSQTYGVEVSNDFKSLIGESVLCATPTQSWETKSGNPLWNEGPTVFKKNGKYFLLYSANYYETEHYSVGYAYSDTPLGLYTKPKDNRILASNGDTITGPGHCNIIAFGDEIYLVYHAHTVPPTSAGGRSLHIDKLSFADETTIYISGPTDVTRPLPEGVEGTEKYKGEYTVSYNGSPIGSLNNGMTEKSLIDTVSVKDGEKITVSFPSPADIDTMWIYSGYSILSRPKSADILINGKYLISDIRFAEKSGSAAVCIFSNLPEGTLIENVEITIEATKDSNKTSGITEIEFINYN